MGDKYKKKEKI